MVRVRPWQVLESSVRVRKDVILTFTVNNGDTGEIIRIIELEPIEDPAPVQEPSPAVLPAQEPVPV